MGAAGWGTSPAVPVSISQTAPFGAAVDVDSRTLPTPSNEQEAIVQVQAGQHAQPQQTSATPPVVQGPIVNLAAKKKKQHTKLDDNGTGSEPESPASPTETTPTAIPLTVSSAQSRTQPSPPMLNVPDLSDEEIGNAAERILVEFQNSRVEMDLRDNMRQVGENNHRRIITKLIHHVTSSVAKYQVLKI